MGHGTKLDPVIPFKVADPVEWCFLVAMAYHLEETTRKIYRSCASRVVEFIELPLMLNMCLTSCLGCTDGGTRPEASVITMPFLGSCV